uniref:Myosin motor domain-containing protein n=1 Tax=Heterorhabditis bacteriophora TaxID=37862 RepID=A0A1I7WUB8_HETBA
MGDFTNETIVLIQQAVTTNYFNTCRIKNVYIEEIAYNLHYVNPDEV